MRRACWMMFVMLALLSPLLSLAEDATFHLRDGTAIEGQVVRKTGSANTIKHNTGVATYSTCQGQYVSGSSIRGGRPETKTPAVPLNGE